MKTIIALLFIFVFLTSFTPPKPFISLLKQEYFSKITISDVLESIHSKKINADMFPRFDTIASILLADTSLKVYINSYYLKDGVYYGSAVASVRAGKVADYLITKHGILPSRIIPFAMNEYDKNYTEDEKRKMLSIEFVFFRGEDKFYQHQKK